ncbi:hypothetical protein GCM10029964_118340 [Kibdelosporangium lantanae]
MARRARPRHRPRPLLTRAAGRQTWEHTGLTTPPVRYDQRIYDGPVVDVVRDIPDVRTAVVVGHNPDLEDLVAQLTGDRITFKTSTVAVLESALSWADAGERWARLVTVVTPRG